MTTKATITYLLSEEGRKASLLAGGNGQELQTIETEITPELLALACVNSDGQVILNLAGDLPIDVKPVEAGIDKAMWQYIYGPQESYATYRRFGFTAPHCAEELVNWEANRRAHIESRKVDLQPEFDRLIAVWEAREAERAAKKAAETAERKAAESAANAAKETREAEKVVWVNTHGSDYLRDAVSLGYDCQRQYVTERATIELPDFKLDFDDRADWKSRSCPSPEALQEVKDLITNGHQAQVVWLTSPTYELDYEDEFNPTEAIVITDYLGKYDLIKAL